jgi:hypothetical protein
MKEINYAIKQAALDQHKVSEVNKIMPQLIYVVWILYINYGIAWHTCSQNIKYVKRKYKNQFNSIFIFALFILQTLDINFMNDSAYEQKFNVKH